MNAQTSVTLERGRECRTQLNLTECVCYRPRCYVICTYCGFTVCGRARRHCPAHPNRMFLLDMTMCPSCKAYGSFLCEFDKTP